MRFLFTDSSVWTPPATTVFDLLSVRLDTMTTAANKRDVWIRSLCHAADFTLPRFYVTSTKAEANAITATLATNAARVAAGVLAYAESSDPLTTTTSFTLTDVAGTSPDMTGLRVEVNGTPPDPFADWNHVGGYVASPANEVLAAIETLLKARMSAGQILYGFTAAEVTTCHDNFRILSTANQITAVHTSQSDLPAATGYYGKRVAYSVIIGKMRSDEETGYTDIITIGDNVWSLLGDEARTLGGLITTHKVIGMEGPTPIEAEDGTYISVIINGEAYFPVLRSDA